MDYWPQKTNPYQLCFTDGRNLINYPSNTTTTTAYMIISKLLWNSVLLMLVARYSCLDIKNMYLQTPVERREYTTISVRFVTETFMNYYKLNTQIYKDHIYFDRIKKYAWVAVS